MDHFSPLQEEHQRATGTRALRGIVTIWEHVKNRLSGTEMAKLSTVLLIVAPCFNGVVFGIPPDDGKYVAKMRGTPDLLQTLKAANFDGEGKEYCAPVAVSNSLMWLGNHGYPRLLPQVNGNARDTQIELVRILASAEMMNTGPISGRQGGTTPDGLVKGVSKYVESCGYKCKLIECQGWRYVSKEYNPKLAPPNLDWIKSALVNAHTGVWWDIGWYRSGKESGVYERIGGHWLTLVGYREDKRNPNNPGVFILHDPALRAGKSPARENVRLKRIEAGSLVGNKKGLPQSAIGYYLVGGGMHVEKNADYAILDCVIAMELAPE